jgi:spermidine synthase
MNEPRAGSRLWLVYLLFFLSGAAGLVYEISWSRQIGLLFGNTVNAAAVVLAAYFTGLSAGYIHASRVAPKLRHPLLGYGIAELTVALWAIATPLLLALMKTPHFTALLNSDVLWQQTLIRAAVSLFVLLPATAGLGATLPFIAQYVSPPHAPQPQRIAIAYGWNTGGAVLGVLAATFVLILYAGVVASSYIAAGVSAVCGLVAILIQGNLDRESVGAELGSSRSDQQRLNDPLNSAGGYKVRPYKQSVVSAGTIYLFAALSGFGTLALQVLYTRLFALVFHNSTYTFGSIAAVFLIALALASWLFNMLSKRFSAVQIVGASALLGAATIPSSVLLMQRLTGLEYFNPPGGFGPYIFSSLALIGAVIFIPILILGLMLPALWVAAGGESSGKVVGRITAANTLAATAGSLLASFLILPKLGLWTSFTAFALLYLTAGLTIALRPSAKQWMLAAAACLLLIPQIALLQHTNAVRSARAARLGYKFLFDSDSPYGAIDVIEKDGVRILRQNRHYTLGTSAGVHSEKLQGALPLMLCTVAQPRVCFLGLATGITASAGLEAPNVKGITAVELVPDVVKGAAFFKTENGDIAHSSKVDIVINDARHYLYAKTGKFDMIDSDLFVPWHSQTGYLYTVEHYRACKDRLNPGGIFCQWLPLYQLSARELRMIADSFATVFPYTYVFLDSEPEGALLMLAGTVEPHPLLKDKGAAWKSYARPDVAKWGVAGITLGEAVPKFKGEWHAGKNAPLNTDEHPRVEFLAPISQRQDDLLTGKRLEQWKRDVLGRL